MAKKITKAGDRTDGKLKCPNCGGDDWEIQRSRWKYLVGMMARRSIIRCVSCRERFKRG